MLTIPSESYISRKTFSEFKLWKQGGPLLTQLDIELTERCNNRCTHCCINLDEDDTAAIARELATDQIKKIITDAAGLGALYIRFTGGEPLLRDDFEELYFFSRRQGLRVILFTNARLITPRLAELFSRVPPLEMIEVSVYGMSESSYEAVAREKGSYEEFKRGVDLLLSHNIPFFVKSALLPANRHETDDFEKWAAGIPWMKRPPSYALFLNLRDRKESSSKRNEHIKKLRISPEEGIAFLKKHATHGMKETREFCSRFMGPPGDLLFSCGAGQKPCVDAYGNLQPCLPLRHPDVVYPLEKGSLNDAITSFFPRICQLRATNSDYLTRCARCFLKGLCEQCPAKSWSEHGTLDTPVEYYCTIAHTQARDLGLLEEGEKGWEVVEWKARVAKQ